MLTHFTSVKSHCVHLKSASNDTTGVVFCVYREQGQVRMRDRLSTCAKGWQNISRQCDCAWTCAHLQFTRHRSVRVERTLSVTDSLLMSTEVTASVERFVKTS